jgi:hypothetical protein
VGHKAREPIDNEIYCPSFVYSCRAVPMQMLPYLLLWAEDSPERPLRHDKINWHHSGRLTAFVSLFVIQSSRWEVPCFRRAESIEPVLVPSSKKVGLRGEDIELVTRYSVGV